MILTHFHTRNIESLKIIMHLKCILWIGAINETVKVYLNSMFYKINLIQDILLFFTYALGRIWNLRKARFLNIKILQPHDSKRMYAYLGVKVY